MIRLERESPVTIIKDERWICKRCWHNEIRFRYRYCPLCGEEIEWYSAGPDKNKKV